MHAPRTARNTPRNAATATTGPATATTRDTSSHKRRPSYLAALAKQDALRAIRREPDMSPCR